eukprot:CAMPEP_0197855514 /NCGR_PEP_ID=MMETSP1438-20131217/26783_1 /TAXON_ID=1461541 /ORGANISM="Pterosperma sp., Strain CCMP1384" /LENGTH=194 /DNA_ID=CAMNT_0043470653 /DNA_START=232 /DNA_END=816 /DNA_ORIENTATION=+
MTMQESSEASPYTVLDQNENSSVMAGYTTVGDTLFFRPCEGADTPRVAELEAAGFPEDEAASLESIQFRCDRAGDLFLVAVKGENIIGFVNGTLTAGSKLHHDTMSQHDPSGETLCIHSVCVQQDQRRNKVGTKMLKSYIQFVQASTPSIRRIALICKEYLVEFYTSCGFEMVGPSDIVHGKDPWFEMSITVAE